MCDCVHATCESQETIFWGWFSPCTMGSKESSSAPLPVESFLQPKHDSLFISDLIDLGSWYFYLLSIVPTVPVQDSMFTCTVTQELHARNDVSLGSMALYSKGAPM